MTELMLEYQAVVQELSPFFQYGASIQQDLVNPIDLKSEIKAEQLDQILSKADDLKTKIGGNMKELVQKVTDLETLVNSK